MGLGDDLMAVGLMNDRDREDPAPEGALYAFGDGKSVAYYSQIFLNHPRIWVPVNLSKQKSITGRMGGKKFHIRGRELPPNLRWVPWYTGHRHYIDYKKSDRERIVFNRNLWPTPGVMYLTDKEKHRAVRHVGKRKSFCVLGTHCKGSHSVNKSWPFDRWQKLADMLKRSGVRVVNVTPKGTRQVEGAHVVATESFREAAAVIARASVVVCSEGGIHHTAAAFGIPTVVIWGGYISPDITGYEFHRNIFHENEKSPCGRLTQCSHCTEAMKKTTVEEVFANIIEVWSCAATTG